MRRISRLLKQVPIWVWLFVAATQVLTLCTTPGQISDLDEAIQRFGDQPAYAEVKSGFETIRWDRQKDLIAAAILCPVSIGLACWKWSSRNANTPAADVSINDAKVVG